MAFAAPVPEVPEVAGDAPVVTPMRDADILYRMNAPDGRVVYQRMRWDAARWRQRLDPQGAPTFMLTDYRARVLTVVDTGQKTQMHSEAPVGAFAPPGTRASGVWQRMGQAVIAGEACTEWESRDSNGQQGLFCYTEDGLLLGAQRDGAILTQAESVARVAQADEVFAVPAGYREVSSGR